jgi:hypothetical protein
MSQISCMDLQRKILYDFFYYLKLSSICHWMRVEGEHHGIILFDFIVWVFA